MSARSSPSIAGFTLLEVMVATVLTGLVAMMALAAARVTAESAAFFQRDLAALRGERAARQTLLDLIHNLRPPRVRGDTGFSLAAGRLTFTAAGAPPLDPDYDWLVSMQPKHDGLAISARSLGRGPVAQAELRLPRVTGWQVRVLAPRATVWRDEWVPSPVLPAAVAITLWSGDTLFGPPLTVRLSDAGSAPAAADGTLE